MISFDVENNVGECEKLWNNFSNNSNMFDLWEYRKCFYDENFFEPHFIIGKKENKTIGVIPLWKVLNGEYYEFFGGDFTERNKFFVKDDSTIPKFIEQLPKNTHLAYIDNDEAVKANPLDMAQITKRYYLDLEEHGYSVEKYLNSFSKKHKKNVLREIRALSKFNLKVVHNRIDDFDAMVQLNKSRFGKDSFFAEESFVKSFKKLIETAKKRKELHLISIEYENKVVAVDLALKYNDEYHVLMGGNDYKVKNAGKLLILEHINNAIKQKARVIDFLSTDSGWKNLWNLKSEPVFAYTNAEKHFTYD